MASDEVRRLMREATSDEMVVETEEYGRLPTWELLRREKENMREKGRKEGILDVLDRIRRRARDLVIVSEGHSQRGYVAALNAVEEILDGIGEE